MNRKWLFLCLIVLACLGAGWFFLIDDGDVEQVTSEVLKNEPASVVEPDIALETEPEFDAVALQRSVDDWLRSVPAGSTASVYIADSDNEILASVDADAEYFAASMYKLFVAYAGYQQVDAGEVDPDEIYLGSRTRMECLDAMIRESDSPCAETLWNELGKEELNTQLRELGIENTNMVAITSTAEDAAKLLGLLLRGEGLTSDSREQYLDSLVDQPDLYRRGLPSGFSSKTTAYNKVGWNLNQEWHDTAIVETDDGRQLVVSVFSDGVGFTRIQSLAEELEATF